MAPVLRTELESELVREHLRDLVDETLAVATGRLSDRHEHEARTVVRRALERVQADSQTLVAILLDLETVCARGDRHVVGCLRCRSGAVCLPLRALKREVARLRDERVVWERRLSGGGA